MNFMNTLIALVVAAVPFATALMFGTTGEVLCEKSGNLNLGVEGIMYIGGAFGLAGAFAYEKAIAAAGRIAENGEPASSGFLAILIAIACAFAAGAITSLIYSFITVTLRANQNVTGLALTIFGTGIGQFTGEYMRVRQGGFVSLSNHLKHAFAENIFGRLSETPVIGPIVFGHNIFFYLALLLAITMYLFLVKTRKGLYLRAVGESPATADSAGINITRYKYLATVIGGGISAIGGMVYIMTTAGATWNHEGLSGVGWLSVALVIFCIWNPLRAIWGSALFGALMIMYLRIVISFVPTEIYKILPYIVTTIVLVASSMRNNKEKQPPASLGYNYFREER